MSAEWFDCLCFRLPKSAEIKPMFCRPAWLYISVARTVGKGDRYINIEVLEKTEEDKKRSDFEDFFRHCGRFANKPNARVDQHWIGERSLLLTQGYIFSQYTLSAVMDLDNNHYLHASITYSVSKNDYPSIDEGKNWDKLKHEEAIASKQYLLDLLTKIELLGNYQEVIQQIKDKQKREQQAEQEKEQREKLAEAAKPIDCDYFSLPSIESLTEVELYLEQVILYFERSPFKGKIDILLHRYQENTESAGRYLPSKLAYFKDLLIGKEKNARKEPDFLTRFRSQIVPVQSESKGRDNPIHSISVERYSGYLTHFLSQEQVFYWVAALDLDTNHYLSFTASYQRQADAPNEEGGQAAEDIEQFLQTVLNALHIKKSSLAQSSDKIEWENLSYEERIKRHQQHYTSAEQQAADPFHARYYPKDFAQLEKTLERFDELPKETRQGIYTNARLAIGFMPTEVDDYSQKGNTRFYGLPDLPPGVQYPQYQNVLKDSPDGKSATLCKFLAQINFAELKGMQDYLPKHGVLYLFIDSLVVSNIAFGGILEPHMAFYYAGDTHNLQSAKDLDIKPDYIYDVYHQFENDDGALPARVQSFPYISILDTAEESEAMEYPPKIYDAPIKSINQALLEAQSLKAIHSINAHVEGSLNEDMIVNGEYVGSPYVEAAQALGGKPDDYLVLLSLGWDTEISEFMFGDAGTAYLMIAKERLKNLDFSQIYFNATSH